MIDIIYNINGRCGRFTKIMDNLICLFLSKLYTRVSQVYICLNCVLAHMYCPSYLIIPMMPYKLGAYCWLSRFIALV